MPFVTLLVPFFPTLRLVFTVQASQASAAVQQKRTSLGPFRNKNKKQLAWMKHKAWVLPKNCNTGQLRLIGFPS